MARRDRPRRRGPLGIGAAVVAGLAIAVLALARSCAPAGDRAATGGAAGEGWTGLLREGAVPPASSAAARDDDLVRLDPPLPSPAAGWEEAAEAVSADLRRILDGRPRGGAFAEAQAEAARQDLALFPPGRDRLRRLLLGSERERVLALAALAARPELDDDLLRIVLRSQRAEDDEVVRLLGAEIAHGLAPDLVARHEDDLLRAFERETNPLVLAVALPALERMDEARLRALLRAQLAGASPEMLPVLLALARGRLAPRAIEDLEASLAASLGERE